MNTEQFEKFTHCPLTKQLFVDPVSTCDGHTFEQSAISAWLQDHDTNPITNEHLDSKKLIPNLIVRDLVKYHRERNLQKLINSLTRYGNKDDFSLLEDLKQVTVFKGLQAFQENLNVANSLHNNSNNGNNNTGKNDSLQAVHGNPNRKSSEQTNALISKRKIITGDSKGGIRIWNLADNNIKRAKQHYDSIMFLVNIGKTRFASGGFDGTVRLWDLNATCLSTLEGQETIPIGGLASVDEHRLIGTSGAIYIWDINKSSVISTWGESNQMFRGLEIVGNSAVSTTANKKGDDVVKLFDLSTGKVTKEFTTQISHHFRRFDDKSIVGGEGHNFKVAIWDLASGSITRKFAAANSKVTRVRVLSGTNKVLSGHEDGTIRVWDAAGTSEECVEIWKEHTVSITGLEVCEGTVFSSDASGKVRIWNNGSCVKVYDNEYQVTSLLAL